MAERIQARPGEILTADRWVMIEQQSSGYVRYRAADGRRWEVRGTCNKNGACLVGAVIRTGRGPVQIESLAHLEQLKQQLGAERIDSLLDVPVTPEFNEAGCCQFQFTELVRDR